MQILDFWATFHSPTHSLSHWVSTSRVFIISIIGFAFLVQFQISKVKAMNFLQINSSLFRAQIQKHIFIYLFFASEGFITCRVMTTSLDSCTGSENS